MNWISRLVRSVMDRHTGLRIRTALTHYRDGLITGGEARYSIRLALRKYTPAKA